MCHTSIAAECLATFYAAGVLRCPAGLWPPIKKESAKRQQFASGYKGKTAEGPEGGSWDVIWETLPGLAVTESESLS